MNRASSDGEPNVENAFMNGVVVITDYVCTTEREYRIYRVIK